MYHASPLLYFTSKNQISFLANTKLGFTDKNSTKVSVPIQLMKQAKLN